MLCYSARYPSTDRILGRSGLYPEMTGSEDGPDMPEEGHRTASREGTSSSDN